MTVPTDADIRARRPDLILHIKDTKKIWILDVACAWERLIKEREGEKRGKYGPLAANMGKRKLGWHVEVGALVIGTLGTVHSLMSQLALLQLWSKDECRRITKDVQF